MTTIKLIRIGRYDHQKTIIELPVSRLESLVEDLNWETRPDMGFPRNIVVMRDNPPPNEYEYEEDFFFPADERHTALFERLEATTFVTETYWEADDHGEYGAGRSAKKSNGLTYVESLLDWSSGYNHATATPDQIIKHLIQGILECDYTCWGGTLEDWKVEEMKREAKELENAAVWFSGVCGHPVGTMEYIRAAHNALDKAYSDREDEVNYEAKMERWMAHRYYGSGEEGYYADEDYIAEKSFERIEEIAGVLRFLETHCPLLYLATSRMQEQEQEE
jgi:hypothetical protein